jgi:hypothetical protein
MDIKTDIELLGEMDLNWLLENGWSIRGNLALRRILEKYNNEKVLNTELIEEVLMRYECDEKDYAKITESLEDLVLLKKLFE